MTGRISTAVGRWSRFALVGVFLCFTVGATAALAWEALRSDRSARATAESVLRDYSRLAAWQFAREAEVRLDARLSSILISTRHQLDGTHATRGPERPPPGPANDCACPALPGVEARFLLRDRGDPVVAGAAIAPEVLDLVRARLAREPGATTCGLAVVHSTSGLQIVAFERPRGSATAGVVARAGLLTDVLAEIFDRVPLLPQALTGGSPSRELFSARVRDGEGREVFSSGGAWSTFAGEAALPPRLGGLRVEAAMRSDQASRLVIGGLPASRWPVSVGLLGLSTLLVILAVVQLHREVRFSRQQSEFVSGVSHELRTPLAQIRLFGETLLFGRVRSPEEARRAAAIIVQESRRLTALVDNVLVFSRTAGRRLEIRRELVDVPSLVEDVAEGFEPFAAARGSRLTIQTAGFTNRVRVDPGACRQILLNLLDNAVKYGPRNQTIALRADRTATGVAFIVEDDGPGIDAADVPRIWEPFWRRAGSPEGGSGLGLSIVSELARLHGGRACLDPTRGRGARFMVTVAEAAASEIGVAASPA
jgi:signal transduction histidine kinase